ncbi:MAG: sugar transferase [Novosphingobium sp.]|nr:sugar transferase [Novosphingobium sp.]
MMKRMFEFLAGLSALVVFALPMAIIAIAVKLTSPGPVLYWSDRVGRDNGIFSMPKFRSMRIDTPAVATHLLDEGASYLSPIGGPLRRWSLDELPQIWSVIKGDMSLVGPRPALFNQHDLIALRTESGVHRLKPGLTGWAQVNGRDDVSVPDKAALDAEYLARRSFKFDVRIVWMTFLKVVAAAGVAH